MNKAKSFDISKNLVSQAYKEVKSNKGSAGIDDISLEDFDNDLKKNLYKIWNRMSSGTYFPPAVKAVEIPKKTGGIRVLGIPIMYDRAMQTLYALALEPIAETTGDHISFAFRKGRSAKDACEQIFCVLARKCSPTWVLEGDIKGCFDNINHDWLLNNIPMDKRIMKQFL